MVFNNTRHAAQLLLPTTSTPHHRAAGESPSTVSRMLGRTSEVFSLTRYGHLTYDAGDSPLPLYGMSA